MFLPTWAQAVQNHPRNLLVISLEGPVTQLGSRRLEAGGFWESSFLIFWKRSWKWCFVPSSGCDNTDGKLKTAVASVTTSLRQTPTHKAQSHRTTGNGSQGSWKRREFWIPVHSAPPHSTLSHSMPLIDFWGLMQGLPTPTACRIILTNREPPAGDPRGRVLIPSLVYELVATLNLSPSSGQGPSPQPSHLQVPVTIPSPSVKPGMPREPRRCPPWALRYPCSLSTLSHLLLFKVYFLKIYPSIRKRGNT